MMMTMTTTILLIFVAFTTADEKKRISVVFLVSVSFSTLVLYITTRRGREIFFFVAKRPPINGKLNLFL